MARLRYREYTGGTASFTVPLGVRSLYVWGLGGGGGGGGGSAGDTTTTTKAGGGGGGGGAQGHFEVLSVSPGDVLDFSIGAPGTGGPGANPPAGVGTPGTDGGDTTIERSGVRLATFAGGAGGQQGKFSSVTGGGNAVRLGTNNGSDAGYTIGYDGLGTNLPGNGGYGASVSASPQDASIGIPAVMGPFTDTVNYSGNPGTRPANSGSYNSGGGGGGGGHSNFPGFPAFAGYGGNGGTANGNAGVNSGLGFPGTAGAPGLRGCGGGGGGGGPCAVNSGGAGQAGGDGGTGYLIVAWVE